MVSRPSAGKGCGMGKKNTMEQENSRGKGKKGRSAFICLNHTFKDVDEQTAKNHILYLIIACVVAKVIVAGITTGVFHSFVDLFDIGVYLQHGLMPLSGQSPFTSDFQYPVLIFVPVMIAVIPALLLNNAMAFVYTFQFLMVICDIVTILCIYLIGLRLWDERRAFYAGLIYACAFSAAYFVITKYDAFPTCLLMLALLLTIYRHEIGGYVASVLGFFAKVFPVLALPFCILYNAKKTSLKQELISAAKAGIPLAVILFLPLFLISPETLRIYIPVRSDLGYYSNTLTFTLFSWLHDVFGIGVSIGTVSLVMYIVMGIALLALLYAAFIIPDRDPVLLIKLILCAIILVVICARVRSPQYIVWFTPLLCLLAADNVRKIAALFIFQGLAYIEFPLMFGGFYTALTYTDPVLSGGWMITLVMFTLEYLALFFCVWLVANPADICYRFREALKKPGVQEKNSSA